MTVSVRSFYGPVVLAGEVGLTRWQFDRAEQYGLLPAPGYASGWLPEQVDEGRLLVPAIVEQVGAEHPIGAGRCADRLSARLGIDVQPVDIETLAEAGHLVVVDVFEKRGRRYDLYSPADIDALSLEQVQLVVNERALWAERSLSLDEAAAALGWHYREIVVEDRAVTIRLGRIAIADVDALAGDEGLRADRLVTADHAAVILDSERRHFDICVEAGWIVPKTHHTKRISRYSSVSVPLYRTGDIEALLDLPDVNWHEVRETPKGTPSPLLEQVGGQAPTRAKVIRKFLRDFGIQHSIEMWVWWVPGRDVWEIDWERTRSGPAKEDVLAAIRDQPAVARYLSGLQLHSAAGAAVRFARAMLEPGRAVVLDTETTDLHGAICEASYDASTAAQAVRRRRLPGQMWPVAGQQVSSATQQPE